MKRLSRHKLTKPPQSDRFRRTGFFPRAMPYGSFRETLFNDKSLPPLYVAYLNATSKK